MSREKAEAVFPKQRPDHFRIRFWKFKLWDLLTRKKREPPFHMVRWNFEKLRFHFK